MENGTLVKITTDEDSAVAPVWKGRLGKVVRWVHDGWYIVEVGGRELVLDLYRGEFKIVNYGPEQSLSLIHI